MVIFVLNYTVSTYFHLILKWHASDELISSLIAIID